MSIKKDLKDLSAEGIISPETAEAIANWYKARASKNPNRILILFGILGAMLVGLGVILLLAHNWDAFPRAVKTIVGLSPLLIGQGLCAYVLLKKDNSTAWRETVSILLFFGIATSIAIIGQVYHLSEDLGAFLLTWMLLSVGLVYIMRSQAVSLLYIIGIACFAMETYSHHMDWTDLYFPLLLALVVPNYIMLIRRQPDSNFTLFHRYLLVAAMVFELMYLSKGFTKFINISLAVLFGLFYVIGKQQSLRDQPLLKNPWHLVGSLGSLVVLYIATFSDFWGRRPDFSYTGSGAWADLHALIPTAVLVIGAVGYMAYRRQLMYHKPMQYVIVLYPLLFWLGYLTPQVYILFNLLIVAIAVITILQATQEDSLLKMNYGTLMILLLIAFRFFDSDLDLLFRGLIFLLCGVGFFLLNFYMIKKRNKREQA